MMLIYCVIIVLLSAKPAKDLQTSALVAIMELIYLIMNVWQLVKMDTGKTTVQTLAMYVILRVKLVQEEILITAILVLREGFYLADTV